MSDNPAFAQQIPDEGRGIVETMRTEPPVISNNFNAVKRSSKSNVQHLEELSTCFNNLFENSDHTDVTLVLDDGTEFASHRLILAIRSSFFRAMLFTGFQESHQSRVSLHDTNSAAFQAVLQYMYTSKIEFAGVELDILLEYLSLAHRYDLNSLMTAISEYLKEILINENMCSILNAAYFFQLTDLVDACMLYSDKHAEQLLENPSFPRLTADSLKELLVRDSFCVSELKIFDAVRSWYEHNPTLGDSMKALIGLVRLPLISQTELLNFVRPSGLIEADDLLDAIEIQSQKPAEIRYRGYKTPNINVVPNSLRAPLLPREESRRYTNDDNISVLFVDLGKPNIINTIMFDLIGKPTVHELCYEVLVSMDSRADGPWTLVADYWKFDCHSQQRVFFNDCVVRYILLKFTSAPSVEHVQIEAKHSSQTMPVDPKTRIIVANQNVATVLQNARVVEGVSRQQNALINGEMSYDWDTGYTCHQIGSGHILIQLTQPYIISSMRILLWNCDDRFYSYYVAVSTNLTTWTTVVDRADEHCRGWQELLFDPLPVVYIKLVGTRNSINEVFHVVHLEAPSTVPIAVK